VTRPRAVLFDLLTALIDSWSLWDKVAGGEAGRRWRQAYLRNTYASAAYRPYETLVREAAIETGLSPVLADRLVERYGELEPWPEVAGVLGAFVGQVPLAVVTNCSEALGQIAAARTGIVFHAVVTAERAGFYKPHPRPYRLALDAVGTAPEETLFVAGSPYDLVGASAARMPVYWHDRGGMAAPPDAPPPKFHHDTLQPLPRIVLG
jgi:2-haloalkanoic acid dehalogenase type II